MDNRFYRQLVEQSPTGYCLYHVRSGPSFGPVDFDYVEMNPSFELLTGLNADQTVGHSRIALMQAAACADAEWADLIGEVARHGSRHLFECAVRSTGKHLQVLLYSPEADYCVARLTDITRYRDASDERQLILTALTDMAFVLDEQYRMTHCFLSEEANRLIDREQLLGKGITDLVPPSAAESVLAAFRRARETGGRQAAVFMMDLPEGRSWNKVDVCWRTIGGRNCYIASVRDITDQRKLLSDLEMKERLLALTRQKDDTLADFLQLMLAQALDCTASRHGIFLLYDEAKQAFIQSAFRNGETGECGFREMERPDQYGDMGFWSQLVTARQPVMVNDARMLAGQESGFLNAYVPIERCLAVPVLSGGQSVAIAVVANKAADYEADDILSLELLLGSAWPLVELRQNQKRIRDSEDRFRQLFETSLDAVVLSTPEGGVLMANPAAERIFGCTAPEIRQLGAPGLLDMNDARLPAAMEERRRTGRFQGQLRFLRKNGEPFTGDIASSLYTDSSGRQQISLFIRDVTERLHLEQLLQTTLASLREGVIVIDASGRIDLVNDAAERITGYARADLIGREFQDTLKVVDPRTGAAVAGEVVASGLSGQEMQPSAEYSLLRRDGSDVRISASFRQLNAAAGGVQGMVLSFRDISREYALQREIDAFLDVNLELLCVTDAEGRILRVNRQFERILGYESSELEGKYKQSFIHPDDLEASRVSSERVFHQDEPVVSVNRVRLKDGSYRFIEWHAMPAANGLAYSAGRDVTEKLRLEEQLKAAAIRDELTGLYNRHYFESIIVNQMDSSDRYNVPLSLLIIDLDHFKDVNDTWGHPVGDDLLRQTATVISATIRESDLVFRFGGEEFVVLMPNTGLEGALTTGEKIRRAIESHSHAVAGFRTASIGAAERLRSESFRHWYRRLDDALYAAKQGGRNRMSFSDGSEKLPLTAFHMEWQHEWESGVSELDKQHLMLMQMSNRLVYFSLQGESELELRLRLEQLLEEVARHFRYEEELLFRIGYKEAAEHASEHRSLMQKARRLQKLYESGEIKSSAFFSYIIDDLIIGHMSEQDVLFLPLTRSLSSQSSSALHY